MKFEVNINTLLIVAGFLFIFIYMDRCSPSANNTLVKMQQDSIDMWQDSVLASEQVIVALQLRYKQDSIRYRADSAFAEMAYQKLANSRGNTSQIKPKYEAQRLNIITLDADESIRLLTRRAAAIDSIRLHRGQNK
jgi:hypothetical protein